MFEKIYIGSKNPPSNFRRGLGGSFQYLTEELPDMKNLHAQNTFITVMKP